MPTSFDSILFAVAGPSPLLSPESGVDCPCPWFHANSLCCPAANSSQLLCPSQLSFASPYHFRIRRDFRSKNPLSGFAPKQTKESSALAAHPHSATTSPRFGEGATPFLGLFYFYLDPYLIILSVNQGGIKYHSLSLWYDSTVDWTPVLIFFRVISHGQLINMARMSHFKAESEQAELI